MIFRPPFFGPAGRTSIAIHFGDQTTVHGHLDVTLTGPYGLVGGSASKFINTYEGPYELFGIAYSTYGDNPWAGFNNTYAGPYALSAKSGARSTHTLGHYSFSATGTAQDTARLQATHGGGYTVSGVGGASLRKTHTGYTFSATAAAPDTGRLQATHGGDYALTIAAGARLRATGGHYTFSATATAPAVARLSVTHGGHYPLNLAAGARLAASYGGYTHSATGTAVDVARLNKTHHGRYALNAVTGGELAHTLSHYTHSAAGTVVVLGRLSATAPHYVLSTSGEVTVLSGFHRSHKGKYVLVGDAGASLAYSLAGGALTASAFAGASAEFDVIGPAGTLYALGTTGLVARFDVIGPALRAVPVGVFAAALSGYDFSATAIGTGVVEYEGYSVTLLALENGQLGIAMTRYTTYPFDRIVRFLGKYYGVASDGLFELEGDTFDGDPIVAVVQTMETDFNRPEKKRFPGLFLSGRVGVDMDVTVLSSELGTNTYSYALSAAEGASTHRVKFGKGIVANFVAYGFTNTLGEDFTIDALMPEVDTLERTV